MADGQSKYAAFISYSHAGDLSFAERLQRALERFDKPWYKSRQRVVFRDATNLSASSDLWGNVVEGLENSEWFILVASPESAVAQWVGKEITWWLEHRSVDRILIAQSAGSILWSGSDFDQSRTNAVHPALFGQFAAEPLWVDLRSYRAEGPKGRELPLGESVAGLLAPITGQSINEIVGDHVRQARRTRRTIGAVATVLTILTIVALISASLAVSNQRRAENQTRVAVAQMLAANARMAASTDLELAQLLAVQAFELERNPATERALYEVVQSNPMLSHMGTAPGNVTAVFDPRQSDPIIGTDNGSVYRWRLADGEFELIGKLEAPVVTLAADDAGRFVAGSREGGAHIWGPQLDEGADDGEAVAVSPDGSWALFGGILLNLENGAKRSACAEHDPWTLYIGAAFSSDSTEFVCLTPDGWERYAVASPDTPIAMVEYEFNPNYGGGPVLSADGEAITYHMGSIPTMEVWAPRGEGGIVRQGTIGDGDTFTYAVSDKGSLVASVAGPVISVSTTAPVEKSKDRLGEPATPYISLEGLDSVSAIAFDGTTSVIGASQNKLAVWQFDQVSRAALNGRASIRRDSLLDLRTAIHPGGQKVAVLEDVVGGEQGVVVVTPEPWGVDRFRIGDKSPNGVYWSLDGTRLCLEYTGVGCRWFTSKGDVSSAPEDPTLFEYDPNSASEFRIEQGDGSRVSVQHMDGLELFWVQQLHARNSRGASMTATQLSPDGRYLFMIASADDKEPHKEVQVWFTEPRDVIAAACKTSGRALTVEEWEAVAAGLPAPSRLACS